MPIVHLTDRKLKSLRAGSRRETFWDDTLPGFGVRVSYQSGEKTFLVRYRSAHGRRPQVTLGSYPSLSLATARKRAKKILAQVAEGHDPAADRTARRAALNFGGLAALYIERHAKRHKRRWQEDQRQIERDLLPAWKNRKATDVRRADVLEVLDAIVDRDAPIQANRTRALASKIFRFGIERGLVDMNPVSGTSPPAPERQRERVLTNSEIRQLWRAFERLSPLMGAAFKLRLLTAQRGIEVMSMRHEDLDGEWWTIPAETSKNKQTHRVPLSAQARAILDEIRPLSEGSPWVFPSPRGGHLRWVQVSMNEIRDATGIAWTAHDLRRTAATYMTGMGIPRLVVSKILNHAEPGVTAVYDRSSYDSDKRQALIAWGTRVEGIVSGRAAEDKVAGRIG